MKIVIEHKKMKREINGTGFNICGSAQDLIRIATEIKRQATSDEFSYGWILVRDYQEDEHTAGPNSPPLSWIE